MKSYRNTTNISSKDGSNLSSRKKTRLLGRNHLVREVRKVILEPLGGTLTIVKKKKKKVIQEAYIISQCSNPLVRVQSDVLILTSPPKLQDTD